MYIFPGHVNTPRKQNCSHSIIMDFLLDEKSGLMLYYVHVWFPLHTETGGSSGSSGGSSGGSGGMLNEQIFGP